MRKLDFPKEKNTKFQGDLLVDKHFKEILVMNLMYNLLLAIVLSVVAQILSAGEWFGQASCWMF